MGLDCSDSLRPPVAARQGAKKAKLANYCNARRAAYWLRRLRRLTTTTAFRNGDHRRRSERAGRRLAPLLVTA